MERRHLLVSGRVQGVFFRASTEEVARAAGCTGWVRNLPDGRVEVEVQGEPEAVKRVATHCRTGPDFAAVDEVEERTIPPVDGEQGFRTR
jgi:acylphosphatase